MSATTQPLPKNGRLPATIGRCPGCNGPLDYEIDGGDERGVSVNLTCVYDCDDPGLQMDWQPVIDRAEKWVNEQLPDQPPNL